MNDDAPIRDAATVILVRDAATSPAVLMGQRGARAAFMPSKFVFPGGAVDAADAVFAPAVPLEPVTERRLGREVRGHVTPQALALAGIRELWEETGLRLGAPAPGPADAPDGWRKFAAGGGPDASALHFFFRAITPPGRSRRFDARFFVADAGRVSGDPDDFSGAADELSHLQWVHLDRADGFDLPFITRIVLQELGELLPRIGPPDRVPFYDNGSLTGRLRYL